MIKYETNSSCVIMFVILITTWVLQSIDITTRNLILITLRARLFTVLYFSVRSSRSSALRYGLPSCK